MPRYKCLLAYVGTRYAGWQVQDVKKAPLTIQGELEKVLLKVTGSLVRVHAAGRTDAGVHAEGQVVHFTTEKAKSAQEWEHIFGALLPPDICVQQVHVVTDDFHSRFKSIAKTYRYTLWIHAQDETALPVPPRLRPFVWSCGHVDVQRMQGALPYLRGKHDFCALQNVGTPMEDTERTIQRLELGFGSSWAPSEYTPHTLTLEVQGDGFLKQMVRNMTGLLVAVGKGKLLAHDIPQLLAQKHRPKLPATAPACGLTLWRVYYDDADLEEALVTSEENI